MKPLHTSSQVTASDSRMVVRVGELSTPDGPVRRIVVEVNAEMDAGETRELISHLTDAVAIAEANDKPRQHPLTEFCFHCASDNMLARGIQRHDESKPWDGPTVHMQTPESFCPRMNDRPAVSEDQPKPREPRVFPKGSPEPEGVEVVTDEAGFRWNRAGRVNARQHHWRRADLGVMGSFVLWTRLNRRALSEVLAPSGDQPKPRMWQDSDGDLWDEQPDGSLKLRAKSPTMNGNLVLTRRHADDFYGPLVEVLADSEQATR